MFRTLISQPLYNIFILLADLFPALDAGFLVIIFTFIVRLILFPLSKKAYRSQMEMKRLQPKMEAIKAEYPNDKEMQAKKIMEVYSESKTNPFSGIVVLFLQIPIIFGLYYILVQSGLPVINADLLYSFIPYPAAIDMSFLGLAVLTEKSLVLAILAGITSYIQIHLSSAAQDIGGKNEALARMMKIQMRVIFPILAFVVSWQISGVVGLYWTTSNILTIIQDLYLKKKFAPPAGGQNITVATS